MQVGNEQVFRLTTASIFLENNVIIFCSHAAKLKWPSEFIIHPNPLTSSSHSIFRYDNVYVSLTFIDVMVLLLLECSELVKQVFSCTIQCFLHSGDVRFWWQSLHEVMILLCRLSPMTDASTQQTDRRTDLALPTSLGPP